jgi:opacity protein-like surface antigen
MTYLFFYFMLAFFASAAAYAADPSIPRQPLYPVPVLTQPRPAPQPFDWNRCFAGAQIGTKTVRNDLTMTNTDFVLVNYVDEQKTDIHGAHVGLQAGCNKMLGNGLVIGFEVEGVYGPKAIQRIAPRALIRSPIASNMKRIAKSF